MGNYIDDPYVQAGTSYQVQRQLQAHPEWQTHSELQAHPEVPQHNIFLPRTPLRTPYNRSMYLPYATHNAVDNRMWHSQNNWLEEQHMQQPETVRQIMERHENNMALQQQKTLDSVKEMLDAVKEMLERHENNMALQQQKTLDSVKEMLGQQKHMQQQQRKNQQEAPKPLWIGEVDHFAPVSVSNNWCVIHWQKGRNLYVLYLYLIYQEISADFTVLVLNIQMLQQLRRSFCTFVYEKN